MEIKSIFISLCILCIFATTNALHLSEILREEWEAFKLQHDKTYDDDAREDFKRMRLFAVNNYKIARHNQLYEKGQVSYTMAMNEYGDMTHEDFVKTMNGYNGTFDDFRAEDAVTFIPPMTISYPQSIDWRNYGAVTDVKNQGSCGSCWAFSTTGALEGQYFRKYQRLVSLSEQNLVDCSRSYGNYGCNGGLPSKSYLYIRDNKGIDTEQSYPYEGIDSQCRFQAKYVGATDKGYSAVQEFDEDSLQKAVATIGPVSVLVDANNWQFYSSGVFFDDHCASDPMKLNHAVLAVGYGNDGKGNDFWLIKNSWGTSWGEQGYMKLARNRKNHCGVATRGTIPLV